MSADTMERTDLQTIDTEDGDHDRFAHYFRKDELASAWLDGQTIQAVCGKWDVPIRDPEKYPVCPECKEEFDKAPKEARS